MVPAPTSHSIEVKYTLDYLCYLVQQRPASLLHLVSADPEIALGMLTRLLPGPCRVTIENEEVKQAAWDQLRLDVSLGSLEDAQLLLYPFCLERYHGGLSAPVVVGCTRNSFSYKRLLYPRLGTTNAWSLLARLQRDYRLTHVVGAYPPKFLALWGLSHLARRWIPPVHFALEDRAMAELFTRDSWWRWSHIILVRGEKDGHGS